MQETCASHRILRNPIWFRYLFLMGQNASVLGGYACMRVYVRVAFDVLDLIELLHRFSYVHTNSPECILVLGKIAHLVRWWNIPHQIPHSTWCQTYLNPWAIIRWVAVRIGWRWSIVSYSSNWLLASCTILAGISFPPNIMAYDRATTSTWVDILNNQDITVGISVVIWVRTGWN
jgi:hypothetical protein